MPDIGQKRKDDLLKAWCKICAWTKANCAGKFPDGKRFNFPHDVYIWNSLVINANGEARIYRGDHADNHRPNYVLTANGAYGVSKNRLTGYNHSEDEIEAAKTHNVLILFKVLEELIRTWPSFKERILSEISWVESIEGFEP